MAALLMRAGDATSVRYATVGGSRQAAADFRHVERQERRERQ